MNRFPSERLYNGLPAVFRERDRRQGEPLRALLAVMEEELERLETDVEGLHEDTFLETAAEWVVPYLADLFGFDTLGDAGFAGAAPRTQVSNVLDYRRRKGTAMVLERTFHDVTGIFARVVESFRRLAHTQNVLYPRRDGVYGRGGTFDVRRCFELECEASPFHTPDVFRTLDTRHPDGNLRRVHVKNLHAALWRLLTSTLDGVPATDAAGVPVPVAGAAPRGVHLDSLERDLQLFNQPEKPDEMVRLPEEHQLPVELGLDALDGDLRRFRRLWAPQDANLRPFASGFYGRDRGLEIALDGLEVAPIDVVARSLGAWGALGVASGDLTAAAALTPPFGLDPPEIELRLGGVPQEVSLGQLPTTFLEARQLLEDNVVGASVATLGRLLLIVSETSGQSVEVGPTVDDPTTADDLRFTDTAGGESVDGFLSGAVTLPLPGPEISLTLGGTQRTVALADVPRDVEQARELLEAAIRLAGSTVLAFSGAVVFADRGELIVVPGLPSSGVPVTVAAAAVTVDDNVTATDLRLLIAAGGEQVTGLLSGDLSTWPTAAEPRLMGQVTLGNPASDPPAVVRMPVPADLPEARRELESALRFAAHDESYREARVCISGGRLLVLPGDGGDSVVFAPPAAQEAGTEDLMAFLKLDPGAATVAERAHPSAVLVSGALAAPLEMDAAPRVDVTYSGTTVTLVLDRLPQDLEDARALVEEALRQAGDGEVFDRARVAAVRTSGSQEKLFVIPGTAGAVLTFASGMNGADLALDGAPAEEGRLSGELVGPFTTFPRLAAAPAFDATLGGEGPHRVVFGRLPQDIGELVSVLDCAFQLADKSATFRDARVARVGDRAVVLPGVPGDEGVFDDGGSGLLAKIGLDAPEDVFGAVTGRLVPFPELRRPELLVSIGGTLRVAARLADLPAGVDEAAALLEGAIRAAQNRPAFRDVQVLPFDEDGTGTAERLLVVSGTTGTAVGFRAAGDDPTAQELGLLPGVARAASVLASGDHAGEIVLTGSPEIEVSVDGAAATPVSFTPASTSPAAVAAALDAAFATAALDVRVAAVEKGSAALTTGEEALVRLLLVPVGAGLGKDVKVTAAAANPATVNELRLAGAVRRFEALLSDVPTLPLSRAPVIGFQFGGASAALDAVLTRRPRDIGAARSLLEAALLTTGFTGAQVLRLGDRLAVLSGTFGDAVRAEAAAGDPSTALLLDFAWRVAVDPCRGRALLDPVGVTAGAVVSSRHTWGHNGRLGGGPYDRRDTLIGESGDATVFDVEQGGALATLGDALAAAAAVPAAVIRVLDNGFYEEDLTFDLASTTLRDLVIEAADGRRPTLRPATAGNAWVVIGSAPPANDPATGAPASRLRLNGLVIDAELELRQSLRLELVHTTLVPRFGRPGLSFGGADADAAELEVVLEASIAGAVQLPATAVLVDVRDSVVDAGGFEGGAEPRPALVGEPLDAPLVLTAGPEIELAFGGGTAERIKLDRVPRALDDAVGALDLAVGAAHGGTFPDAGAVRVGRCLLLGSGDGAAATSVATVSPVDVATLGQLRLDAPPARQIFGRLSGDLTDFRPFLRPRLRLTVGGEGPHLLELSEFPADPAGGGNDDAALADAVERLTAALADAVDRDGVRAAAFAGTEVLGVDGHLLLLPGGAGGTVPVGGSAGELTVRAEVTGADRQTAADLRLLAPDARNASGVLSGTIDLSGFEKPKLQLRLVKDTGEVETREVVLDLPHDVGEVQGFLQAAIRDLDPPAPAAPFPANTFTDFDVVRLGDQLLARPVEDDQEVTFEPFARYDLEISGEVAGNQEAVTGSVSIPVPEDLEETATRLQDAIRALPAPVPNPWAPVNPFATVEVEAVAVPGSFFGLFFGYFPFPIRFLVLRSGDRERDLLWNRVDDPASAAADLGFTGRLRVLDRAILSAPLEPPVLSPPSLRVKLSETEDDGSSTEVADRIVSMRQVPVTMSGLPVLLQEGLRRAGTAIGEEIPLLATADAVRVGRRVFLSVAGAAAVGAAGVTLEVEDAALDDPTADELALTCSKATRLTGLLSSEINAVPSFPLPQIRFALGEDELRTVTLSALPTDLPETARLLERALHDAHPSFSYLNARVALAGDRKLIIASGVRNEAVRAFEAEEDPSTVEDLRLTSPPAILRLGLLSGDLLPLPQVFRPRLTVKIGNNEKTVSLAAPLDTPDELRMSLENALAAAGLPANVELIDLGTGTPDERLLVEGVPPGPTVSAGAVAADPDNDVLADATTVVQLGLDVGVMRRGLLSEVVSFPIPAPATPQVQVAIGGIGPLLIPVAGSPTTLAQAANAIQNGLRSQTAQGDPFTGATVTLFGTDRLQVLSGDPAVPGPIVFSDGFSRAETVNLTPGSGGQYGILSDDLMPFPTLTTPTVNAKLGGASAQDVLLSNPPVTVADAAIKLQSALSSAFSGTTVAVLGSAGNERLVIRPPQKSDTIALTTAAGDSVTAGELALAPQGTAQTDPRIGLLSDDLTSFGGLPAPGAGESLTVEVLVGGVSQGNATLVNTPADLSEARTELENALQTLLGATVVNVHVVENRLLVVPTAVPPPSLELRDVAGEPATATGLELTFAAGASQSLVSTPLTDPLILSQAPHVDVDLAAAGAQTVSLASVPTDLAGTVLAFNDALTAAGLAVTASAVNNRLFLVPDVPSSIMVTATLQGGSPIGTASALKLLPADGAESLLLSAPVTFTGFGSNIEFGLRIGSTTRSVTLASLPPDITALAADLQAAINAASNKNEFKNATVVVLGPRIFITPGNLGANEAADLEALDSSVARSFGLLDAVGTPAQVINGLLSGPLSSIESPTVRIRVAIENEGEQVVPVTVPASLTGIAANLQEAIRGAGDPDTLPGFANALVGALGTRLVALPGLGALNLDTVGIGFSDVEGQDIGLATALKLSDDQVSPIRVLESGRIVEREPAPLRITPEIDVTLGDDGPHRTFFTKPPRSLPEARVLLENALHRLPDENPGAVARPETFKDSRVLFFPAGQDSGRLLVVPGLAPGAAPGDLPRRLACDEIRITSAGDGVQMAELTKLDERVSRCGDGILSGNLGLVGAGILLDKAAGDRRTAEVRATVVAGASTDLEFAIPTGSLAARALLEQELQAVSDGARVLFEAEDPQGNPVDRLTVVPGSAEAGAGLTFAATANDTATVGALGLTGQVPAAARLSGDIDPFPLLDPNIVDRSLDVDIDGTVRTVVLTGIPTTLAEARDLLQDALGQVAEVAFNQARVFAVDGKLLLVPGVAATSVTVTATPVAPPPPLTSDDANLAKLLRFDDPPASIEVQVTTSGTVSALDLRSEVTIQLGATSQDLLFEHPTGIEVARQRLESALRDPGGGTAVSAGARVFLADDERLVVLPGPAERFQDSAFLATADDPVTAPALGLTAEQGAEAFAGVLLGDKPDFTAVADADRLDLTVTVGDLTETIELALLPEDIEEARDLLETALRSVSLLNAPGFTEARVVAQSQLRLVIVPNRAGDAADPGDMVTVAASELAGALGLEPVGEPTFPIVITAPPAAVNVTLGGAGQPTDPAITTPPVTLDPLPTTLGEARCALEKALRQQTGFEGVRVEIQPLTGAGVEERLIVIPGRSVDRVVFNASGLAQDLGLVPTFQIDASVPTPYDITVTLGTRDQKVQTLTLDAIVPPATFISLAAAAVDLQNKMNTAPGPLTLAPDDPARLTWENATVEIDSVTGRLRIVPGVSGDQVSVDPSPVAQALGFFGDRVLVGGPVDGFPDLSVTPRVEVTLEEDVGGVPTMRSGTMTLQSLSADLEGTRDVLQRGLRAVADASPDNRAFDLVQVSTIADRLLVLPGAGNKDLRFYDTARGPNTAVELGLGLANRERGDGLLSRDLSGFDGIERLTPSFEITLGGDGPYLAQLRGIPDDVTEAASFVQKAVRGAHEGFSFLETEVLPVGNGHLLIEPGRQGDTVTFEDAGVGVKNTRLFLGLDDQDSPDPPRSLPVGTLLSGELRPFPTRVPPQLKVTLDGTTHDDLLVEGYPATREEIAAALQAMLNGEPEAAFQNAVVEVVENHLHVRSTDATGNDLTAGQITFEAATAETSAGVRERTVHRLRLDDGDSLGADGLLSGVLAPFPLLTAVPRLRVAFGDEGSTDGGAVDVELLTVPGDLDGARQALEDALRRALPHPNFLEARVAASATDGERLIVVPGREVEIRVEAHPDDDTTVAELGLAGPGVRPSGVLVSADLPEQIDRGASPQLTVGVHAADGTVTENTVSLAAGATDVATLAADLEAVLRAEPDAGFTDALVAATSDGRLLLVPGGAGASIRVTPPDLDTVTALGLVVFEALGTALGLGAQGPPLSIERSTVFGRVAARELLLASETLFTAPLSVEHREVGCVRYSFLPEGSRTPRRFRSQPDLALANALACVEGVSREVLAERFGPLLDELGQETLVSLFAEDLLAPECAREIRRVLACLRPVFTSVRYGDPAYAQLATVTAVEIRTGAEDGSEIGVYQNRQEPRRRALLRELLNEYLRFGLEAGLIEMT